MIPLEAAIEMTEARVYKTFILTCLGGIPAFIDMWPGSILCKEVQPLPLTLLFVGPPTDEVVESEFSCFCICFRSASVSFFR